MPVNLLAVYREIPSVKNAKQINGLDNPRESRPELTNELIETMIKKMQSLIKASFKNS